jgi:hypothetical protein
MRRALALIAASFSLFTSACTRDAKAPDPAPTAAEPSSEVVQVEGAKDQTVTSHQDGYSTLVPIGWTYRRETGALVFTSSGSRPSTIFVQSGRLSGEWVKERTPELILNATERALRSLPQAIVKSPVTLNKRGFKAVAFDLSYAPRRGEGRRYDRRHIVLIGKRVLHVVHTAQSGALGETAAEFQFVVDNLKEEA